MKLNVANAAINPGGKTDSSPSPAQPTTTKKTRVKQAITTADTSTQKTLDCQAFIVSLSIQGLSNLPQSPARESNPSGFSIPYFVAGPTEICCYLPLLLQSPMTEDVSNMISDTIGDANSAQPVRELKAKLEPVMLAYEPLVRRFTQAAESDPPAFPSFARDDAARAEKAANELYSWASTFVSKGTRSQVQLNKQAKLMMTPYLVIMAYAVRVKLDAHYVESSMLERAEKLQYLERSCSIVNGFVALLRVAISTILQGASLLELALDYQLSLTTYVTLTAKLQRNVQMMLAPGDSPRIIDMWDDKLSNIR